MKSAVAIRCVLLSLLSLSLIAPPANAAFGFRPGSEGFDVIATEENSSVDNQAGSHPFALTTTVNLNLGGESTGQPGVPFSDGDLRDLHIDMPPGLIENPSVVPACTQNQFHTPRQSPYEASLSGESCPDQAQIGVVAVHSSLGGGTTRHFGVYNLPAPPGALSQFGFAPFGVPITLTSHVRQGNGEYATSLDVKDLPQLLNISGFQLTLWGTPWLIAHDRERGDCLNEVEPASFHGSAATLENEPPTVPPSPPYKAGTCSTGNPKLNRPKAYLTMPATCAAPIVFEARADSWQQPAEVSDRSTYHSLGGLPLNLDCGALLSFHTVASVEAATDRVTSPSGVDVRLDLNQEGLVDNVAPAGRIIPDTRGPSQMKKAVVSLPEGMTINPSVAVGLGVCTPAEYAAETATSTPGEGCPNSAKIGDLTVESPLFEERVAGSVYIAQPDDPTTTTPGAENPFDALVALYLVAKAPERGILVKLAGQVSADPASGQLVTTFDDLPQLPYSHFDVHFREGQRSLMLTPSTCGTYTAPIDLTPWIDPGVTVHGSSSFHLGKGIGGEACPVGTPPFRPQAQAGTLNSNAGSYTPFYLHLTRTDSEQEVTSYSATLPPGLVGKIAGIPFCPEADIEAAKRARGVAEEQHPSCPPASEIGHTVAGFGVGTTLAYAPGKLYLAGPFHGSSFSIVAIDSATVGPFDLGTIVVRSAIEVNPQSAQVSIDSAGSDPIPHIIDGIPLHLRDIRVYISRPQLTVNPTSCNPFLVNSTLNGSGARFSDPSDDAPATATAPFQASDCSSLGFAPRLSLKLKGGIRRGDYPALTAVVTPRAGDANIASAAVALPPSEFLAQEHLDTVCTRPQLARETCPLGSIYGHAQASTPLLGAPLEGPVYLVTGFGTTLPELVAALRGGGIGLAVNVYGRIDSVHGGLRGTFEGLPDAQISKFTMVLNGGKNGILVNERNVCTSNELATARFIGQNNKGELLRPRLEARCAKGRKHRKHSRSLPRRVERPRR